jgi:hypothetical protein
MNRLRDGKCLDLKEMWEAERKNFKLCATCLVYYINKVNYVVLGNKEMSTKLFSEISWKVDIWKTNETKGNI